MGKVNVKNLPADILAEAENLALPYAEKALADVDLAYADAVKADPTMAADTAAQMAFDKSALFATQIFTRAMGEMVRLRREIDALKARS